MIHPLRVRAIAFFLAASAAPAAFAHHSLAMYDRTVETPLEGVVKDFEWTNPHVKIQLVVNENGRAVQHTVEASGPGRMAAHGWKNSTLKPGDRIVLTVNPLKTGGTDGLFVRVQLPDGSVLTRGDLQPYAR